MRISKGVLLAALLALIVGVCGGCYFLRGKEKPVVAESRADTAYCPVCKTYMPREHFLTAHDGKYKHLAGEEVVPSE